MLRAVLALTALTITVFSQSSSPTEPNLLLEQLAKLHLDKQQIYSIRDIAIHRDVLSISFNRGTIAFLEPLNGRVTGALFIGSGEIVAIAPDNTERQQLSRYTQSPVLNEQFDSALLRFTDNTYSEIMTAYQDHAHEDVESTERVRMLAWDDEMGRRTDAFNHRVLSDLAGRRDRPAFLAQLKNDRLGWFSAAFDQRLLEEVRISGAEGVWASFKRRGAAPDDKSVIDMLSYDIDSTIASDMRVTAKASLRFRALTEGERVLNFVLAPSLRVSSALAENGQTLAFSQNADRLAVVLPEPLKTQQEMAIQIVYAGGAIDGFTAASPGVSSQSWYPTTESADWARVSLTFHFPATLNLLATGGKTEERDAGGERHSSWTSESEILGASFTISKCTMRSKESGPVSLHTCIATDTSALLREIAAFRPPSPQAAKPIDFQSLGEAMLDQIRPIADYFQDSFGSYPFKRLNVSTLPSVATRSGPSLIYLSLVPFLSKEERENLGLGSAVDFLRIERLIAREISRLWFGQATAPRTYRDRWITDGLAGYAAAMYLEHKYSAAELQQVLGRARLQLLERSPEGTPYESLGPLSIGSRLTQPQSTEGYINVIENKSTWIMHMLRMLMRRGESDDNAFLNMLRELTAEFRGAFLSTSDFKRIAEKYAGEPLDWFFDEWVFGTGIPAYTLEYKIEPMGEEFLIEGQIHQTGGPDNFTMRLPLYTEDRFLGRVTVSGSEESFRFTTKQKPQRLLIDPNATVLKLP